MTCSWCGQKIHQIPELMDDSYCSEEHRRFEVAQIGKLALARLLECAVRNGLALNTANDLSDQPSL